MQLDCNHDNMTSSPSCGKHTETPCCHLQEVLNKTQEGATVYVSQASTEEEIQCNQIEEIHVEVRKSFTLKTLQETMEQDSRVGIHGMHITFINNCSELCSLAISQSNFSCSILMVRNLDVTIKDTQFTDSFLIVQSVSESHTLGNSLKIEDSEFMSVRMKEGKEWVPLNEELGIQLQYVSLTGNWNLVTVSNLTLKGDKQSNVSGIHVMNAKIEVLALVYVEMSFLFSAMVIHSSSSVGICNVTDSIFLGNRDGIDIGEGVRYMVVYRSQMNNTGSWFGDGELHEQCCSALKGSAQFVKVEDSLFAHNRASGMNCTGTALSLRSNVNGIPLLDSSDQMFEMESPLIHIEVMKSVFYDNIVENCYDGLKFGWAGGGAITVHGFQHSVKISGSTFVGNQACRGGGLYVGVSGRWLIHNRQNRSPGKVLCLRLIIDTCIFSENTASTSAGLMTEFTEYTLDNGSSLSTLIYNSSFNKNKASVQGAGADLYYSNISVGQGAAVIIKFNKNDFEENISNGSMYGIGGGISVTFASLSLVSYASVKTEVGNCNFNSNTAMYGAGMFLWIGPFSTDSFSSMIFKTTGCTFISNTGQTTGAGISTMLYNCSIHSHSFVTILISDSTFTSNSGQGMYTKLKSCSVHSKSSIIIQTMGSNFTFNTAKTGAGSATWVEHGCSADSNSSIILQATNSIFISNSAERGAGMFLQVDSFSEDSFSSIILKTTRCTFISNTAERAGAGIHTLLSSCSIHSHSFVTILISDSTFTSNSGQGMDTRLISCSAHSKSSIILQATNSIFISNSAERGAGMFLLVDSFSVNNFSSIILKTSGSTFTSNTAKDDGSGIYTSLQKGSIDSNSFITLDTADSIFTLNSGAGIYTQVLSCSLDANSSITSEVTDSTFISNSGRMGTGIHILVDKSSIAFFSSMILQTTGSTFISNMADGTGGGIAIFMQKSSVHSNSSFVLQTLGSNFTSNKAKVGAGIIAGVLSSSLDSDSSILLQTTGSLFAYNTANNRGAGILITVNHNNSFYSNSLFIVQLTGCAFLSNRAERGAGISLSLADTCLLGEFTVDIINSQFQNNSASWEGGAIYFMVFSTTQIYVEQSVFENNQAFPGSGLYLTNVDSNICSSQTQAIIPTFVVHCQFINNTDTAILVKGKHKYITFIITKCLFKNNMCIHSSFAEDVFTETKLELRDTSISKWGDYPRILGINSQSDSIIDNVTINTAGLSNQRQINIAQFSHYITKRKNYSFECQCPAFYQPTLSTAGLSDAGAVMLQITCKPCSQGYYIGRTWLVISAENDSDHHCDEKQSVDLWGQVLDRNRFCYTRSPGICIDCPHGANCSAGVMALPNYWGHMKVHDRLEFHSCPVGYCCNQAPCKDIGQCATHRVGILCGRCVQGFTESLITPECIPNEACSDWWIFPLFCLWTFTITLVIVFSQDILQIKDSIWTHIKRRVSKKAKGGKNMEIETCELELRTNDIVEIQSTHGSISSESCLPKTQSIETQTYQAKIPILWGALTIQRDEKIEASGSHKYLQIILYYLQDAALMQVDLALAKTIVTPIQKLRQLLLNVSQLAVDLIDLGLNLCPIPDWTPVSKLLTKNLTGLSVFCYIFAIYGIIKLVSWYSVSKRKSLRDYWYPRLTAAAIFSILLFYQQIANVAFSLLHCINSGDQSILFIDGTVTCYQPWQIIVFVFAFNWVIGIIPVFMFLPGLLEVQLISVSHFFYACLMPVPILIYWLVRFYRNKLTRGTSDGSVTPWHEEALRILQKTFVKTTDRKGLPICWIGFMKVRRLALVILFTFFGNLVARVCLMCFVIQLFLLFHLTTRPYQDDLANNVYTASLLATLAIGILNIMKAACVEFYLDLDKVAHFLTTLNMITDGILVYCPLGFVGLTIVVVLTRKFKAFIQKKRAKRN